MGVKYVNGKAVYTVDKGIDLSHKAKIDKSKIQNSKSRTKALTKEYEKSRKKYKGKEKKRALPKVKNNSIAGEAAKNAREYRKKNPAKKTEKRKNKAREYSKKVKDQKLTSNEKLLMQNLIRTGSPDVVKKGLKNAEKSLTTSKAKTKEYKNLNKRVAKQDEKFLNSSPAAYGFMAGSSPIPLKETIERQTGRKLNTKKAEKSIGYKAGYMGGIMAEYALTGGVARASVQKSIETGAKQLAKKSAKKAAVNVVKKGEKLPKAVKRVSSGIAADTVTGIPTNTLEAGKESMIAGKGEKGKAFARSLALNTALDVGFGGAMEALPAAVKGAKAAKASRSSYIPADTVPRKNRKVYKEYVRANDKGVIKFAEKAQSGKVGKKASYKLSDVTAEEAEKLKKLTGIDTTGYTHSLKVNSISHIEKKHGSKGLADKSMADMNDLSRMNYVIKNADDVDFVRNPDGSLDLSKEIRNSDGSKAVKIKYTKKIDGHYYVVEAVPDNNKKRLQVVTAYIDKAGNEKAAYQVANAAEAPSPHARNGLDITAKDSIPQARNSVNADLDMKKAAYQVADTENSPLHTSEVALDITADNSIPKAEAGVKNIPESMPDARKFMSPETQERVFDAVSKRSGAKIEFADLPEGVDGVYKNGVIKISNNAQNPAYTVMKHELTHHIETSGHYKAFADFVENNIRNQGVDVDGMIDSIISDYKAIGKDLTKEEARKEFTAKFTEEVLFNSEKSIERLARENPSLFRQVYEWIVDTIHKIGASPETRFLIDAQRKYEKALKAATTSADDVEKYLFVGAEKNKIAMAERMEADGASPEAIKRKLNMHREADGKWRFETDDSKASFYPNGDARFAGDAEYQRYRELTDKAEKNMLGLSAEELTAAEKAERAALSKKYANVPKGSTLADYMTHPELYNKYPDMEGIKVNRSAKLRKNVAARYLEDGNAIDIDRYLDKDKFDNTLIHEVQHAVQDIEGFQNGTNTFEALKKARATMEAYLERTQDEGFRWAKKLDKQHGGEKFQNEYIDISLKNAYNVDNIGDVGKKIYANMLGEREARAAERRLLLDEESRRGIYPTYGKNALVQDEKFVQASEKNNKIHDSLSLWSEADKNTAKIALVKGNEAGEKLFGKSPEEGRKVSGALAQNGLLEKTSRAGSGRRTGNLRSVLDEAGDSPAFYNAKVSSMESKPVKPLESRVSGDELLDAKDNIDLIKDVGGDVDSNGYVTLYHRTSHENAERIRKSGNMSAKEDGVFFSTSKSGYNKDYGDDVVELKVPVEKLQLDDIFDNEAHFRIPLKSRESTLDVSGYIIHDKGSLEKIYEKERTLSNHGVQASGFNNSLNNSIPERLPEVKGGRIDRKAKQLEIIRNSNKMTDDYHVGIRDADDIKTFEEAMKDSESFFYGDFSLKDARKALKEGKVTVYSSKPIEQGGFVSTSKNMAKDYAGGGEVYSRRVGLDDVAWINGDEGQYAKVSLSAGSRLKDDTGVLDSLRKVSENLYGEKGNRYLPDARNIKMVEADNVLPRVAHAEKTKVKGEAKAARYERRSVRTFDRTVKEALDISRYGDNRKIKQLTDEAVEKMKSGSLTSEDKDKLFDTIFEEGINVDMTFLEKYKHLKDELRSKPLKVTDSIRKDIADFNDFRKGNMGTLRLSKEGRDIETEYLELRSMYPELFPEKNTPAEMLEELSGVMKSIKATETKISKLYSNEEADAFIKYSRERFDAALNELDKEIHIVKRYMKKPELYSREELNSTVYDINRFRREADKVKRDNLLTDEDRGFVDMLHAGKLRPENVEHFSPNSKGVLAVYNAEKKVKDAERPLKDIGERTRAYYEDLADKALEQSDSFKDKKSGWRYNRETAERNIIDIAGKENGEEINRIYFTEVHNSEALATELKNGLRNEIKKLKISTKLVYDISGKDSFSMRMRNMTGGKKKLSESSLVQLCGEGKLPEEELELFLERFGDPARKVELREKIEQSVETFRRIYDDLFHYMNQELIRNGYPPMEYRKNYFPHFEESRPDGLLAKIGSKLGFDVRADELPTDIAGLTHTFRPGKKWFAHALSRTADVTEYDALKGFDMYLEGAADIICHTENIQKLRAFENAMRYKYSDQAVKDEVYRLRKKFINGEIGSFEYHTLVDKVYETRDKTKLANLATWTRRYTDNLAGKKSIDDRSYEYSMGRIMYDVTKAAEGQLAANMVAVNPASWLTNFIPLVQGGNVSPANVLKGMAQTVQNRIRRDGLDELSIFLTNRKGSDVLWKSRTEKWQDFLTKPMKMIDEFTSEALFRAKYHDEVAKGASQLEAVRAADRFAADVIADRSKGALPIAFNSKNPVKKIFTMFQVEVNNQWSHLMKDIPRNSENVAAVAFAFTNFFVASYIFNDVYEHFIGRRPALDPIGWANDFMGDVTGRKVPNLWDAAVTAAKGDRVMLEYVDQDTAAEVNLAKNVVKDIPFVGGFLEGGRLPISSALPDMWTTGKAVGKYFREDDSKKKALSQIGREMIKPAAYLLPPVGGGQAKKIYEAGRTFAGQGDYGLDKDGEQQLKFAADRNAGNVIKGALFGKYAMGSGQEYIDSGFKMLSAKKTAAFKEAVEAGMKPSEAEQFIRSLSDDAETARNYIYKSDLTDSQKNAVGKAIQKNDKKIDYSNETSYKYSMLNKQQKEKVDELRDKGFTKESALKIREAVKGHSSQMAQVMALAGTGYDTPEVYAALGIKRGRNGNGPREKAEVLSSYGLSIDDFDTVKEAADRNGSGNVSIEEAMRYLDGTDYGRKECYALTFAMTGCKHGNNPYR